MKVAFILPINGLSGGIFVVYGQARALRERGHDVTLLFEHFDPAKGFGHYRDLGLPHFTLDSIPPGTRFDVAIATWWETFFRLGEVPADRHLYFVQSDERRFYPEDDAVHRGWVAASYGYPEVGVITEARWIRRVLTEEFGLDVEYAPNGVDPDRFSPEVAALEPPPASGRARVLIEGPGGQVFKRIDDAFAIVRGAGGPEDFEIWYVTSDGVRKPGWRADRVFHAVPFESMPAIYRSCDILVKVSAVEGFFGPPLEMMACGGASLVSAVTGHDEYIRDGENALVMPIGDVARGAELLRRLREDPALRARLGRAGRETAVALDWRLQYPKFETALRALAERRPPTPERTLAQLRLFGGIQRASTRRLGELENRLAVRITDRLADRYPGAVAAVRDAVLGANRLRKKLL